MDDNGRLSLGNIILFAIGFPWAVAVLLDQVGLFDPALDVFFFGLEMLAKSIGRIVGGL
jgi:hypothetical protein